MAYLVGVLLALAVGAFGTLTRLDRERGFYAVVMIVIAAYYVLFALMGGSAQALWLEGAAGLVFIVAAVWGFRSSLWWVAAALAAHGLFDVVHAALIANPGVPGFWPPFCLTYDVVAAGYLAWLLRSGRLASRGNEAS